MYKYEDFKDKFADDNIELKLLRLYNYMVNGSEYNTEELVGFSSGDSWETLACIDRLEELRLIRCVDNKPNSINYWMYRKI